MTTGGILGALVIGLIIGALGRLVLPGKQNIPIWLTIVVSMVAALLGSAIVGPLRDTNGVDWVEIIVQVGPGSWRCLPGCRQPRSGSLPRQALTPTIRRARILTRVAV